MARSITISVPDFLETLIQAQAAARGSRTLDECALAILSEALTALPVMPSDQAALEAELRKGLVGEGRTPSAEDWERKKANLIQRHSKRQAG